jgi:hypothetical protein
MPHAVSSQLGWQIPFAGLRNWTLKILCWAGGCLSLQGALSCHGIRSGSLAVLRYAGALHAYAACLLTKFAFCTAAGIALASVVALSCLCIATWLLRRWQMSRRAPGPTHSSSSSKASKEVESRELQLSPLVVRGSDPKRQVSGDAATAHGIFGEPSCNRPSSCVGTVQAGVWCEWLGP